MAGTNDNITSGETTSVLDNTAAAADRAAAAAKDTAASAREISAKLASVSAGAFGGSGTSSGAQALGGQAVMGTSILKEIQDAENALKSTASTLDATFRTLMPDAVKLLGSQIQSLIEFAAFKQMDAPLAIFRKQVEGVEDIGKDTVEIAAVMQRLTGLNADALMRADYGLDTLGQKATRNTFDAVNKLADVQIKLLDGTQAYAAQIASSGKMLENFTAAALNDSRLFKFAVEGMSEDVLLSTTLAMDRLGMGANELHEIFYRELAATGKMSGEYLNEIETKLLAASKVTGDSIVLMSKDLNKMMADFSHYGALTEDQMISLSHTIHQLGINVSDVTQMASKFQSFDSAISTMSQLAATTGLTLDAVEMFEMANVDPEGFVTTLRDQLEAQGLEFEQMNIIQQRQMAQALGIDATTLRVLMNNNIQAVSGMSGEIAAEAGKITDEKRKTLLADMGRVEDLGAQELAKRMTSMKSANIETAAEIERAYSLAANKVRTSVEAAGKLMDASIQKFQDYRKALSNAGQALLAPSEVFIEPQLLSPQANAGGAVTPGTRGQASVPASATTSPLSNNASVRDGVETATPGQGMNVTTAPGDTVVATNDPTKFAKAFGTQDLQKFIQDLLDQFDKLLKISEKWFPFLGTVAINTGATATSAAETAEAAKATAEANTNAGTAVVKPETKPSEVVGNLQKYMADDVEKVLADKSATTKASLRQAIRSGALPPSASPDIQGIFSEAGRQDYSDQYLTPNPVAPASPPVATPASPTAKAAGEAATEGDNKNATSTSTSTAKAEGQESVSKSELTIDNKVTLMIDAQGLGNIFGNYLVQAVSTGVNIGNQNMNVRVLTDQGEAAKTIIPAG